jgi:alpha-N-acetylglucosamine transferase
LLVGVVHTSDHLPHEDLASVAANQHNVSRPHWQQGYAAGLVCIKPHTAGYLQLHWLLLLLLLLLVTGLSLC